MFDPSDTPRVPTPWRLRCDGEYLLAYRCVHDDLKWRIFSPVEATLVTFLDATSPYRELRELWLDLYEPDSAGRENCLAALDRTLQSLIEAGTVSMSGEVSPSLTAGRDVPLPALSHDCRGRSRLVRPLKVSVAPTNRCTTDCSYCYAERRQVPEMSLAQLVQLFDRLHEEEIYLVDTGGGDLFARADALDILSEMVARDFVFFISTKCRISMATATRLADLGIGVPDAPAHLVRPLQISVDSADEGTASMLVGRRDYLQQTDASIRHLVARGIAPRIKCVLTRHNGDAPASLVDHFVKLGVRNFQFVQYGRSHYRHRDDLFLTAEQKLALRDTMHALRQTHAGLELVWQDDVSTGPDATSRAEDAWKRRAHCSGGRVSLQIQPNGDVLPCEQIPHRPAFALGNLLEQSLPEVWNGEAVRRLIQPPRGLFDGTVCFECPTFDECHEGRGYCYRDSLFNYGTLFDAPPNCPRQDREPLRQI